MQSMTCRSLLENPEIYDAPTMNGVGLTANPNYREIFIKDKNANSGLLLTLKNSAKVGDISSIVAKALNCDKKISIQMCGAGLSNEMDISDLTDIDIKKITYTVTDTKHIYPVSVINTSQLTSFLRWEIYKNDTGNRVLKFTTAQNEWQTNLNEVMPQKNDHLTLPNRASTSITGIRLEEEMPADNRLDEFISSTRNLYKNGESEGSYIRTIGIAMNIDKKNQPIIIPCNSWSIYVVKNDRYILFGICEKDPTFGEIATCLGSSLGRVGRISNISQNDDERTLDVPLPGKYQGLYDKVVLQHNKTEQTAALANYLSRVRSGKFTMMAQ